MVFVSLPIGILQLPEGPTEETINGLGLPNGILKLSEGPIEQTINGLCKPPFRAPLDPGPQNPQGCPPEAIRTLSETSPAAQARKHMQKALGSPEGGFQRPLMVSSGAFRKLQEPFSEAYKDQ